ncbi:MAG: extracellular solute-binding protein [Phycisphaerales bacterium]|nr:extracellular solute-binding protein [Phycisphaerales bacterium]
MLPDRILSRAIVLVCALCAFAVNPFSGCEKRPAPGELVLYSSVDDPLLREVIAAFEQRHPVKVRIVGDTEATKTTGLVQRLLSEKESPRADVWWSNEALGTALMNQQGLFEPSGAPPGLPAIDPDLHFHAFAQRARVIAYSSKRLPAAQLPQRLTDLTSPQWKGRIGMARPQFGTTRAHMAFLCAAWGPEGFRAWLSAMKDNGLRLYSGNSAVVRAIADGEIDVGLTDSDDVWTGQREGWAVECVMENAGQPALPGPTDPARVAADFVSNLRPTGTLVIPNTIALIKGGPNPGAGRVFIEFVLSPDVERMLAESDSHNTPVRAEVRAALGPEFERYTVPPGAMTHDLTQTVEPAMKICEEVLGAQ